jgi:N-acetylglucosamine-6-phosphate deacetylase
LGVPRPKSDVKRKPPAKLASPGAVDLHFHGAYGIDLMKADERDLDSLSVELWREAGVAAVCLTTLSAPPAELKEACARLGAWIRRGRYPGTRPLGIHLEGPFLHSDACGAHPKSCLRPLDFAELESLWEASEGTLKILTLAPELLVEEDIKKLVRWARGCKVRLSLGHSRATEVQALRAFELGFRGVTHAWNALHFHHRSPGPMGAALGKKGVYVEIIPDGVHVHPTTLRWTRNLHEDVCFVSDCVPAAGTPAGSWHSFGSLKVHFSEGAARLENGSLAGGGRPLTDTFGRWIVAEARETGVPLKRLWKDSIAHITTTPLRAIGVSPAILKAMRIRWEKHEGRFRARGEGLPKSAIDSESRRS